MDETGVFAGKARRMCYYSQPQMHRVPQCTGTKSDAVGKRARLEGVLAGETDHSNRGNRPSGDERPCMQETLVRDRALGS